MRVLILFNFDLFCILKEWQQEGHSGHHLWGATELPKYGIEVDFLEYEKFKPLKQLSQKLRLLGDLDQQVRILGCSHRYDAIFSAHHLTTALLTFLRKVGLLRTPVISINHRALKKSLFAQFYTALFVEGNDRVLCFSEATKNHLQNDFGIARSKLDVLPWCIDIEYEKLRKENIDYDLSSSQYILSSGRTFRDYETLLSAFEQIEYPLRILGCSPVAGEKDVRSLFTDISQVPANISFVDRFIPTPEAIDEIKKAYAVAIPLKITPNEPGNTFGVTSLFEAMALGKAVIITRNNYLGIDVEREGIGLVVEPGDVDGWREAITFLLKNPQRAQEMGRKGRYLIETKYNLEVFGKALTQQILRAVDASKYPHVLQSNDLS